MTHSFAPMDPTQPQAPGPIVRRLTSPVVIAIGLLLIALNLRIGVASVGPILPQIRDDLQLSALGVSLLTTIPVVAFGLFAFVTPGLTKRLGMHRLLGVTMIALAAGILMRLHPSMTALYAGTVLVGAAIAIANVVMPVAIKHDFAHRTGPMMALYSTVLFVSPALASGLTAPLYTATGNNWRAALGLWAIPAVLAVIVWLPQMINAPRRPKVPAPVHVSGEVSASAAAHVPAPQIVREPSFAALLRDPVALAVTGFMGLQSLSYYAFITWVPSLLQDGGIDANAAGWLVSYSSFPAIAACLAAPVLARFCKPTWLLVALAGVLYLVGYLGLGMAPAAAGGYIWMTVLGLGQGMTISLALSFIVWRSPDAQHTAHVSTLAQGVGYLLAALGPLGLGALHSITGEWGVPLAALGVVIVFQVLAGVAASRDRHVLSEAV